MDGHLPAGLRLARSPPALLALWKTGVLATIPPIWLGIGLLAAIGIGIMVAVANSGKKETIEVNRG